MKIIAALLAIAGIFLFGQGKSSWPALPEIPASARSRSNPLANNPDAPVAGQKLFEQHCSTCHGKAAEGSRKAPGLENETMRHLSEGELFWILTNGVVRHGMPSWSQLPEPQRWQIVSYLGTLNSPR